VTQLARRQVLQLLGGLGAAGLAAPVLAACGSSQAGGDNAGAPVRVGLLAPQLTIATDLPWSPVVYGSPSNASAGHSMAPDLGPPIQSV